MVLRNMERSSPDLVDVLAFVRVVETGSFARAAERMGLSKPVLSRRVARLEEQLGARLLTRTARGAQPTGVGQAYYARAAAILADLEAAQEVVAEAVTQIAGPIRLTAPLSFGIAYLAPRSGRFRRGSIRRSSSTSSSRTATVDLVGGGYDLAVRIGRLADSALIARRIAPVRKAVIASPAYLDAHGRPERPADLAGHADPPLRQRAMALPGRRPLGDGPRRRRHAHQQWRDAARRRRGRASASRMLPSFIAAPAIEDGSVEVILRDYPLEEGALHAVMPPGRAVTARVRALVDFLVERFGPEPSLGPVLAGAQER